MTNDHLTMQHNNISINEPVASIPLGSKGQDPTNFFPCPHPHIGGPGLNVHNY